ncbi:MAG: LamG domain-containing protein, partial [Candidatus Aenigmatarchaeota archaeon]
IMLLMTTVSLIGVFYVFSSTLATQTTSSGSEQASQLTAQLSLCMQIDNIIGNQVTLRNCGEGVIENKSLVVMMDDIALGANTQTIQEGNSSVVNVSGLWQVPFGKHSLKISNGAAVALALVEIIPNPDGLAGSWNFDEGTGAIAYDASGNGNAGTLNNMNTSGNATSGWTEGRFGKGLLFDGADDYVDAGNGTSLNITDAITVSAWVKTPNITRYYQGIVKRGNAGQGYSFMFISTGGVVGGYANLGGTWQSMAASPILSNNLWYHVVLSYNGASSIVYTNVIAGAYKSQSGVITVYGTDNLIIGQSSYGAQFFNGTIDEVRIWSKAFSPDETVAMKQII